MATNPVLPGLAGVPLATPADQPQMTPGQGEGSDEQVQGPATQGPAQPHVSVARHILDALGGSSGKPMDWAKSVVSGGLAAAANVGKVPEGAGGLYGAARGAQGAVELQRQKMLDAKAAQQQQFEQQEKLKQDTRAEKELQNSLDNSKAQRALWTTQQANAVITGQREQEALEQARKLDPIAAEEAETTLKENKAKLDEAHGEMIGLVEAAMGKKISDFPLITDSKDLTADHAKQMGAGNLIPVHNGESASTEQDGVGVYLVPGHVWDQTITKPFSMMDPDTGKEMTAQPGTSVATLAGIIMGKQKSALQANQLIMDKLDQKAKQAQIGLTQAETGKAGAETRLAESQIGGGQTTDLLGGAVTMPPGGVKEANKRADSFKKDADDLAKTEGTYNQFNSVLNDINAGKDITGAQSVVALFNAIGISATPLKGMGMRINSNTVQEHAGAIGVDQRVEKFFQGLKNGEVITPQQIKDYAQIAVDSRKNAYVNKINEARAQGVNPDFLLPRGNGKPIDVNTAQIFYQTAAGNTPQEKAQNALKAAKAVGWQ